MARITSSGSASSKSASIFFRSPNTRRPLRYETMILIECFKEPDRRVVPTCGSRIVTGHEARAGLALRGADVGDRVVRTLVAEAGDGDRSLRSCGLLDILETLRLRGIGCEL